MKLTRKSYNRRIFTFGALVFLSVALMSTGFATWVMSQNASQNVNGGVTVGTITDGALEFTKEKPQEGGTVADSLVVFGSTGDQIRFDADKNDTAGMIKAGQGTNDKHENLSVTFSVVVSPKTYYNGMNIKMTSIPAGVTKAAEANYINLPACAIGEGVTIDATNSTNVAGVEITDVTDINNVAAIKLTYTVSFTWGEYYDKDRTSLTETVVTDNNSADNLNPGFWLDDEQGAAAKNLDFATKKAEMIKFRRAIFDRSADSSADNFTSDIDMLSYNADTLSFTILLTAIAK